MSDTATRPPVSVTVADVWPIIDSLPAYMGLPNRQAKDPMVLIEHLRDRILSEHERWLKLKTEHEAAENLLKAMRRYDEVCR